MIRVLLSCGVGVVVCATVSPAFAQRAAVPPVSAVTHVAAARLCDFRGLVQDDGGQPLAGAIVSALGSTSAFAVSDRAGRFTFRDLPAGPYLVRAHLQEYVPSRGRIVQVTPDGRNTSTIELTRRAEASSTPPVVAAGVAPVEPVERSDGDHAHDEVAWRLRHARRSVLKDADQAIADLGRHESFFGGPIGGLSHAVGSSARLASSLFDDLSMSGQFHLLTTTSFDRPQDLFSMNVDLPKSVAFVSLEAPGGQGDWTMRGTVTQGDLASWILAGSYTRHTPSVHAYEAGVSYGMQRYLGGNGDALAAIRDGSRVVGSMYAFDSWQIARPLRVSYGAKYSRYDYLMSDPGLWSPRASIAVQPLRRDSLTLRASMSRRQVAPGAEEFLPSSIGLWLPPERTFAPVAHGMFHPERHDQVEVGVERTWPGDVVVGVRVFDQRVENQLVTVFGVGLADIPSASGIGHYEVGSAGAYGARGWGVTVSRSVSDRLRATVDYAQADAVWDRRSPDFDALAALERSVLRTEDRVHDLTASVESVVAPTSTRVFVIYKLNAALAAADAIPALATARTRFDVQVNQALPFLDFTNAQWEMLVAVSNLFKEELGETTIYDEALVVRPPKRVLGGVTVKF